MFNRDDKRSSRMLWITIILVGASIISLMSNSNIIPGASIVKDTVANVEYYVIKAPLSYVQGIFKEYNELKDVYEENKKLKRSLDNYTSELALNEQLKKEIKDLKELTGIEELNTDYKVKYTKIIKRNADNWEDTITIDLGKSSNIKAGMAVISSKGMIGVVSKVNSVSSTVKLLTSESNSTQLSVIINDGDNTYYGLINSYDVNNHCYVIQLLSTATKISKNAKVITSGLGGEDKAPKGLLIGKVKSFRNGSGTTGKTVTVTPAADFDDINYVAVVQRGS